LDIRYLQHHEIDYQKWDKCIKKSVNGSIYAYSWFLNIVSEEWDALVDEKYETIMPLPYKKKLGFKLLIQPVFASNLGVFSTKVLDEEVVDSFVKAIPKKFWLININLNKYNKITEKLFHIRHDCVYELDLIPSYKRIYDSFSPKIKQYINKASENKISVITGMNSNDLVTLYLNNKTLIQKLLFRKHINKIKMLVSNSIKFRVGQVYGAYTNENNLCAAAFFIWSHNRVFLLFFGFNKKGLNKLAHITLINEFIKLHAEQNLTLRFEFASRNKYSELYLGFGGHRYEFIRVRRKGFPLFF
jgi:hypothetical protein